MKRVEKKRKAFTLIELLAVIIILGIIALIVTPVITGVMGNAEKASYKESVRNIIRSAENYMAEYLLLNQKDLVYPITFTCDGTSCKNGQQTLKFSGNVPASGEIVLESHKNIKAEYLYNGKYCASGSKDDIQVSKSCADIDTKRPYITGHLTGNILNLTLTDHESGIDSYCVTSTTDLGSCNWNNVVTSNATHNVTHTLSVSGTYYAFAKDKKGNVSDSIEFITGDIENPTVIVTREGKVLTIELHDNASVASYCVTTSETSSGCPEWIEADSAVVTYTLLEEGTYYVFAKDTSDNTSDGERVVAPRDAFCTLEVNERLTVNYTGQAQDFEVPCTGKYKVEVYAGNGGDCTYRYWLDCCGCVYAYGGSLGNGYMVAATYRFVADEILTIRVGGAGGSAQNSSCDNVGGWTGGGGWNGGTGGVTNGSGSGGGSEVYQGETKLLGAKGGIGYLKGWGDYYQDTRSGGGSNYINTSVDNYVQTDQNATQTSTGSTVIFTYLGNN